MLIVKLSSIGDIAHAMPVVDTIKRHQPNLTVGWVVRRRCASLLEGNPAIDQLYVIGEEFRLGELLALGKKMRADGYDTALDMQGLFVSGLITWLSGARRRIGLNRNREANKLFLTEASIEGRDETRHAVDILQGFAQAVGAGELQGEYPVQDYLAHAEADTAQQMLEGLSRPRVAINAGASTPYKQWPLENWIEVARSLGRSGISLVLLGGPSEVDQVREVESAVGSVARLRNLAGQTNLRQLAAVLARCDLMVSGDTGPLHIAGAVGTPTVALFGPTHPRRTGPYGGKNIVIWKQLPCSPCYRHPICHGRVDCLQDITPEEVIVAVNSLLGAKVAV